MSTSRLRRRASDAGQAFPIYITAVAGLLFIALAFFAVGQAGATRNGGQTAADAAALAAGQDYRDQLRAAFLRAVADGSAWEDILNGQGVGAGDACDQAQWFAGENGADLTGDGCVGPADLPPSFTVTVRTRKPVGRSVIPGTERKHATAKATAVVEPRCTPPETLPSPDPTDGDDGGGDDGDTGGGDGGGKDEKPAVELRCEDGRTVSVDPAHLDLFPDAKDLFTVHLAD